MVLASSCLKSLCSHLRVQCLRKRDASYMQLRDQLRNALLWSGLSEVQYNPGMDLSQCMPEITPGNAVLHCGLPSCLITHSQSVCTCCLQAQPDACAAWSWQHSVVYWWCGEFDMHSSLPAYAGQPTVACQLCGFSPQQRLAVDAIQHSPAEQKFPFCHMSPAHVFMCHMQLMAVLACQKPCAVCGVVQP